MTGLARSDFGHPAAWVVAFLLIIMPLIANGFFLIEIFGTTLILGIVALSLMFLAGYGGMVSLMQLTIAGLAGYMTAVLGASGNANISLGWPWWLATPMALALATLFGTVGGALAVRTEGIYTIMITLAIASAFYYFTNQNWVIFNGHTGINSVVTPHFWGVDWRADVPFYYVILAVAALCFGAVSYLSRAPFGLALQGVRDNPRRMAALGFNVNAHRIAAYAFASFVAALGGVLQVWNYRQISPGSVGVERAIDILIIAVVGGITRPIGPFIGALIFVLLRTFTLDFLVAIGLDGNRFRLLIGLGFLVIVLFSPDGVVGLWERWRDRGRIGTAQPGGDPAMDSVAQRLSAVGAGAALELRGVTRLFGALAALTDVTLTVRPGERRAVLGSNGAGKTTLFNCITGDFPPTSGTIRFFGEDVTNFPPYRAHPPRASAHLPDFRAVSGADRSRQRLSCLLRRFARPLLAVPAAQQRRADAIGRRSGPGGASDRGQGPARRRTRPRSAAPARNRARARRRAALHPVRRTGRRPVADRARRTGGNPDRPARPYRLHHHRARHGRRAARRRERDDDAQRPHLQGRAAAGNRIRSRGSGALSRRRP